MLLGMVLILQNRFTTEAERTLQAAADDCQDSYQWLSLGFLTKGDVETEKSQVRTYLGTNVETRTRTAASLLTRLGGEALVRELGLAGQSPQ